jgi:hypothetical protein
VLTFVVAPAAIILVIAGLSLAGGVRRNKRYRPGRSFEFTPVWFLSAPDQLNPDGARALTAGVQRPALTAGATSQGAASQGSQGAASRGSQGAASQGAASQGVATQGAATPLGATGGASDRW